MQIILNEQCDMTARQAGAIYLKNHIHTYWSDYNEPRTVSDSDLLTLGNVVSIPSTNDSSTRLYLIPDSDKDYLRNVLLDGIIRTKDPLRCQLITSAGTMIKNDFPSKWPQFLNQIHACLSTDNINAWESALLVFYILVQHYE